MSIKKEYTDNTVRYGDIIQITPLMGEFCPW